MTIALSPCTEIFQLLGPQSKCQQTDCDHYWSPLTPQSALYTHKPQSPPLVYSSNYELSKLPVAFTDHITSSVINERTFHNGGGKKRVCVPDGPSLHLFFLKTWLYGYQKWGITINQKWHSKKQEQVVRWDAADLVPLHCVKCSFSDVDDLKHCIFLWHVS